MCYCDAMRRPAETEEEIAISKKKLLEAWEKVKMNTSPFFTPKVPDEKPRED